MELLDALNPLRHFSEGEYVSFWQALFASVLEGFWARAIAGTCLFLAFWFGVRRQRFQLGLMFFALTLFITYGAVLVALMGF